jgi:serine/threonine protein kinase
MASNALKLAVQATGKFNLLEEFTEGANAHSFKAFHRLLERNVFLKLYYAGDAAPGEVLREPRLLLQATTSSPVCENIVTVFDTDELLIEGEKWVCVQMELAEGVSLCKLLENGPLGQQEAVRTVIGALHGVAHLHEHGIVHRDLKPGNILIAAGKAKVTDFGSAAVLSKGQDFATASQHSSLYVPPEGWEVPSLFGVQSDVYQLGMVLYELINGPMNYDGIHYVTKSVRQELEKKGTPYESLGDCDKTQAQDRGIAELARKQLLLEYGRPPLPFLSKALRRLIARATHPDLKKRIPSAKEFLRLLGAVNVPSWLANAAQEYTARGWRGWDWQIRSETTRSGVTLTLARARADSGAYRRVRAAPGSSFEALVDYVESAA